jgi:hypothetical protein
LSLLASLQQPTTTSTRQRIAALSLIYGGISIEALILLGDKIEEEGRRQKGAVEMAANILSAEIGRGMQEWELLYGLLGCGKGIGRRKCLQLGEWK